MATTIRAHERHVDSVTNDTFATASTAAAAGVNTLSTTLITRDADTKEWTSKDLASEYHPTWIGWRVERVDAEFTLSGQITFNVRATSDTASAGRVHVRLYKRTSGGSDVESLIAQGDASADLTSTSTTYTILVTPPAPVTLAHNERLLYRIFVKRQSAGFDTAVFTLRYDHASLGITNFVLTETVTFLSDTVLLYPRRTAVAGIGNFFDLLPTRGVTTATTGVVNTTASGTEIQWTRTAGGTALEWISPRFAGSWKLPGQLGIQAKFLTAHESNLSANCVPRLKLFRRRPDGAETLMLTTSYATAEMTTSANRMSMPAATIVETAFAEDDRLVARAYIIPFGTMGGSQTCTISYDHLDGTTGDTSFSLFDMAEFKAEGDPDASAPPSGMSTVGVGS